MSIVASGPDAADRPVVLVTRRLPTGSLGPLQDAGLRLRVWDSDDPIPRAVLLAEVQSVHGLLAMISERVDQELLDAAPLLKVVGNYAVGYDNVDVPVCTRRGVLVCNTPGVLAETTADLTWALLLGIARHFPEAIPFARDGRWQTWTPTMLLGHDVHHATLGIVGMGQIGLQVARRAFGFDMRVLYASRQRHPEYETVAIPGSASRVEYADFDTVLRESDFVSLHVSLSPETRHLIGARELALMKPTAYLVNTARGPVVDSRALYEACRSGQIAGAALDVTDPEPIKPDDPLLTLPNVLILPHVGSATAATRLKMGTLAATNVAAVLTGQRPPAPVNPEVLGRAT